MGATCSTKAAIQHDRQMPNKRRDSRRIIIDTEEKDFDSDLEALPTYKLGAGIDVFVHQFFENTVNDAKYMELYVKYEVSFYFTSTLTHICRGDGILGQAEKDFIIAHAQAWKIPENRYDEILKGKDYSKEFIDASLKFFKDLKPNATDDELKNEMKKHKLALLLQSVIAATQDGLVKSEYENAKKMAKKWDIDESYLDQCIDIIKTEKRLQAQVTRYLSGNIE